MPAAVHQSMTRSALIKVALCIMVYMRGASGMEDLPLGMSLLDVMCAGLQGEGKGRQAMHKKLAGLK